MGKQVKAHELRTKTKPEMLKQLGELKKELSELRIAQVTGGAATRVSRIGTVRKSIARVLTVHNQTAKSKMREQYAGADFIPRDLREKKTRAIRQRLSLEQRNKKTLKQQKKDAYYPQRKFAVMAV